MQNLQTYQQQLQNQKDILQAELEAIEQKMLEAEIAHRLKLDDLKSYVDGELQFYKPQGINLGSNLNLPEIKISTEDIDQALAELFKIKPAPTSNL
jgi:hypothetical protein